jgi:fucose permease
MGMLLFGIVLISLGSILPYLRDRFELSELSTGSLVSTLPFGLLLGSITFGPIVDRFGYKLLLLGCGILIFAGLEGIALTGNINMLLISVFLIGIAGGAINGGTNALVADISEGDRGAQLSLLGVFFGIGALGVPFLLGLMVNVLSYEKILLWIGFFVLLPCVYFLVIDFPLPKHPQGFPIKSAAKLLKDPLIILFGLVLFFQSGLEGLTNNWSTTYLQETKDFLSNHALFSLTCFVIGMTGMRLVLGWALHHLKSDLVLISSIGLSIAGCLMIFYTETQIVTYTGMIILGVGLSACFPVILGYAGGIYTHLSGTAFSIILAIALIGNMTCNYGMGIIAKVYGTGKLPVVIISGLLIQFFILLFVLKKKSKKENL